MALNVEVMRDQDLRGKRVAVIGTGASAVQLIPAIVDEVAHLTVFQRTPIWCLPKPDRALSPRTRTLLDRLPGAKAATRLLSQTYVEATFPLAAHFHSVVPTAKAGEALARKALKEQVEDPEIRRKLTPQYAVGPSMVSQTSTAASSSACFHFAGSLPASPFASASRAWRRK